MRTHGPFKVGETMAKVPITVYIEEADNERIERVRRWYEAKTPGVWVRSGEAARAAIIRGLDEIVREMERETSPATSGEPSPPDASGCETRPKPKASKESDRRRGRRPSR